MPDPLIVPLHSRRRRRVRTFQDIQNAVPAAALLFAGMQSLRGGATGVALGLAVLEVASSVLLIGDLLRQLRRIRSPAAPGRADGGGGIDWTQIWASLLLFTQAAERWVNAHHIARPVILLALLTLFAGLYSRRIAQARQRRRALAISDDGVTVGGRFWRTFRATWSQLADISIGASEAWLRTRTGAKRRIDLADLENAAEARAALEFARQRMGSPDAAPRGDTGPG